MKNCIFCEIIEKKIQSYAIYEDSFTYVFLDVAQDVEGHLLVVPKKHVLTIDECDYKTLSHLMATIKKVSKHCLKTKEYSGFNLLNANHPSAGQSVSHLHFHLILRKEKDGVDAWMKKTPGSIVPLEEIQKRLSMR